MWFQEPVAVANKFKEHNSNKSKIVGGEILFDYETGTAWEVTEHEVLLSDDDNDE